VCGWPFGFALVITATREKGRCERPSANDEERANEERTGEESREERGKKEQGKEVQSNQRHEKKRGRELTQNSQKNKQNGHCTVLHRTVLLCAVPVSIPRRAKRSERAKSQLANALTTR